MKNIFYLMVSLLLIGWSSFVRGNGSIPTTPTGVPINWSLLEANFSEPPFEFNSRPLWFWNAVPNKEETEKVIRLCAKDGYAGLAILPAFPQEQMKFMSPAFLDQYRHAALVARDCGMKLCLYDEYWFPSGSAGGLLKEKYPEHLCKRLDMAALDLLPGTLEGELAIAPETSANRLMGCVAMNMQTFERQNITDRVENSVLKWSKPEGNDDHWKIMAFVCADDGQRDLVDYLEPESVKVFIDLTYAGYQKAMPDLFGTTIDSAFYDEPMLYTPGDGRAWTPNFNNYFEQRIGGDPAVLYPALFFDIGSETAAARNALLGFRATLFSEGFIKTITDWLEPYNVPLTGHLDQEEVVNPSGVTGDAIKFFEYQPIPGLDQIFQYGRGSKMYKLIASAATNFDRHLVMTEVYGGMQAMPPILLYKEALDQAVKGVNIFVPHAVWYNSDPQAITFDPELSGRTTAYAHYLPEYNKFIGRLHLLLQRPGGTAAEIAVLYPIESLQATYHFGGPIAAYEGGVPGTNDNYFRVGEFLSFALRRDFQYIHPETLLNRATLVAEPISPYHSNSATIRLKNKVNPANFSTLIIPAMEAIGPTTLNRIVTFYKLGGRIIFVGNLPKKSAVSGYDEQVRTTIEELLPPNHTKNSNEAGGEVIWIPVDPAGELDGVKATLEEALGDADILFVGSESLPGSGPTGSCTAMHRIIDGRDLYYFTNSTDEPIAATISLRDTGKRSFAWWNPHSGSQSEATFELTPEGRILFPLSLGAVNSIFLIGE